MPKQIVTCSKKGPSSNIQGTSIISTQSASNNNDRVQMCDDNKSLSNPKKIPLHLISMFINVYVTIYLLLTC